jgi:oligopeptide transport system ATP-binding protein
MRQRVMIAMALLCNPELLIADEPTTALDVTVQAGIIDLLVDLQEDFGTSIILITHDLGIVAGTCEDTLVMYDGRVMEYRKTEDLFAGPEHPYTQGLLAAVPRLDKKVERLSTVSYEFMRERGEA